MNMSPLVRRQLLLLLIVSCVAVKQLLAVVYTRLYDHFLSLSRAFVVVVWK